VPPKYKMLGGAAGAVAGTVLGVHAGEGIGRAMDKRAEDAAQPQKPDYNKTLRRIALRHAGVTAKEIGAITLPVAAGMGVGYGAQKLMERSGRSASPMARKILALSAIPAVGLTVGSAYRAAHNLKENEFARIRNEEMDKYHEAERSYQRGLKRTPQPEGL
jgi:hypothetical protein